MNKWINEWMDENLFQSLKLWKNCLLFTFLSPALLFSQTSETDSLNKEIIKIENIDNNSVSIDTANVQQDSLSLGKKKMKYSSDDVAEQKQPTPSSEPKPERKFYWNDRKINADTTHAKKYRHNPTYAALFSAVLPGLGQAYNRKYWKIPIVYAGFGGLGYALYYTGSNFTGYRNAYRLQVDEDPNTHGSYKGVDDAGALKSYRDYHKQNLDISAICTAVWYILNIVDAAVDAHLFEWNMKDDLHLSWNPTVVTPTALHTQSGAGVRLALNF